MSQQKAQTDSISTQTQETTRAQIRRGLQLRLTSTLIIVTLISILVIAFIGWSNGRTALAFSAQEEVIALRDVRVRQVYEFLENLGIQVVEFGHDPAIVEATKRMRIGWARLESDLESGEIPISPFAPTLLRWVYASQVTVPLNERGIHDFDVETLMPARPIELFMQSRYVLPNRSALADTVLSASPDISIYSRYHDQIHPYMKNVAQQFDYQDILIVDAKSYQVIYSLRKHVDFASDLNTNLLRRSGLSKAVDQVLATTNPETAIMVDYQAYVPLAGQPIAFVAAPIVDGDETIAVVVASLSIDVLDRIMATGLRSGILGASHTEETYIVGGDNLMRTNSRYNREDSTQFLRMLAAVGYSEEDRRRVRLTQTSALVLDIAHERAVNTQDATTLYNRLSNFILNWFDNQNRERDLSVIVEARMQGESVGQGKNYLGWNVFTAAKHVNVDGLDWLIVAEISTDEAFEPVRLFSSSIFLTAIILLILSTFASILLVGFLASPISKLVHQVSAYAKSTSNVGSDKTLFDTSGNDEVATTSQEINALVSLLDEQTAITQTKLAYIEKLTAGFVPPPLESQLQDVGTSSAAIPFGTAISISLPPLSIEAEEIHDLQLLVALVESHQVYPISWSPSHFNIIVGDSESTVDKRRHMQDVINFIRSTIQAIIQIMPKDVRTQYGIHIGVASGPLVMAVVGTKRIAFEAWGDPVQKSLVLRDYESDVLQSGEIRCDIETAELIEQCEDDRIQDIRYYAEQEYAVVVF
ncbi:MAG: adenylate/guanylate cyclase domain-containing protein [Chloroflexota bacterium]